MPIPALTAPERTTVAHQVFADAAGLRLHWQQWAVDMHDRALPTLLLLHGTAASTHSWRGLAPRLAARGWRVVAPDLPGHALSGMLPKPQRSLPGMATAVAAALDALAWRPTAVIGHSAGAALMVRMALDGALPGARLLGLNAALLPFDGLAGLLYPKAAWLLAASPGMARLGAWRARDLQGIRRLVASCGSVLDEDGMDHYAQLLRSPAHMAGVLAMMARWDLTPLTRDLARLDRALHLLVGQRDAAVPPSQAYRLARQYAQVQVHELGDLGHLAHEEDPARVLAVAGALLSADVTEPNYSALQNPLYRCTSTT